MEQKVVEITLIKKEEEKFVVCAEKAGSFFIFYIFTIEEIVTGKSSPTSQHRMPRESGEKVKRLSFFCNISITY